MPKQTQAKGEYKKAWRKKNQEEKRFNKVLNKYLKIKYDNIYEECCTFFKVLSEKNPAVKDLTKTTTFRKWEEKTTKNDSDDEAIMMFTYHVNPGTETVTATSVEEISRNDISDSHDEGNNGEQQHEHGEGRNNGEQQHEHSEGRNNTEQQAEQQHDHIEQNNIIQQLVNELEMNQDLYDVLNADEPQHEAFADDEGIGLNIEDKDHRSVRF